MEPEQLDWLDEEAWKVGEYETAVRQYDEEVVAFAEALLIAVPGLASCEAHAFASSWLAKEYQATFSSPSTTQ